MQEILDEANAVLAGAGQLSPSAINECASQVNENFVDGGMDEGYLTTQYDAPVGNDASYAAPQYNAPVGTDVSYSFFVDGDQGYLTTPP